MSILRATDSILRKLNSVLFRVIIVIYSLTILFRFNNIFPVYVYIIVYIIYIILYQFLFSKNKLLIVLRLINDYVFMTLIVWGKPLDDLNISIFLFLPLINTLNHSSDRKLSPIPIYVYILLTIELYLLNNFKFHFKFITPILAITFINILFYIRLSVIDFSNSLYTIIEQFYQESFNIGKTHYLLKRILTANNNIKIISKIGRIKHIALFKKGSFEQLQILISSKFIIKFEVDERRVFEKLNDQKIAYDIPIILDGDPNLNNVFLTNTYESTEYVLFISFDKKPLPMFFNIYLKKILNPLFSKITKIIHVEFIFQKENQRYFAELKKHLEDIDNAINAIHFLNNKLSPITSYFSLLEHYDNLKDEGIKKELLKLIEKERKNSINNILPITSKMNQMAEKANNPNIVNDTVNIKLRKLFSIVRTRFEEGGTKYSMNVTWTNETFELTTKSNPYLFGFILEELIINLTKHSRDDCKIDFAFNTRSIPIIVFTNGIKNIDKNRTELVKIIDDFNSERMSEIMKRNSKGLKIIKQYLEQLDISHKMSLIDDKLILILSIIPL
jgi:hypothetical protein